MYNLIMGAVDGVLAVERLLEGTDTDLEAVVRPGGELDVTRCRPPNVTHQPGHEQLSTTLDCAHFASAPPPTLSW